MYHHSVRFGLRFVTGMGRVEMRDDDAFWVARRVAAFTDDPIRVAVHTGEFSDPVAEKHLADVLIQRRDKIASVYLTAVNPIVSPRLISADNSLYPPWKEPIRTHFRRQGDGWKLVGLERLPETLTAGGAAQKPTH